MQNVLASGMEVASFMNLFYKKNPLALNFLYFFPVTDDEEPILDNIENTIAQQSPLFKLKRWQWLLLVAIDIFFLVGG